MFGGVALLGWVYLLIGALVVGFLYVGYRHWTSPGTTGFGLIIAGGAGWAVVYGVELLVNDQFVTVAAANIRMAFVEVAAVGWFVLGYEIYRQRHLQLSHLVVLIWIVPVVQFGLWTDPFHGLARKSTTYIDSNGVLHTVSGPLLGVHTLYNYVLILLGLGLLLGTLLRSRGLYRDQVGTLIVGGLLVVISSAAYTAGITLGPGIDPTPLSFVPAGLIMLIGVNRLNLFELTPVARDRAMAVMDEVVVTIDTQDRIVDYNAAARELLQTNGDIIGTPVSDALGDYPELLEKICGTFETDTEVKVTHGAGQDHYLINVSPIGSKEDNSTGRVVVLRDITALKEREADLALLKQVLSRVLRHNVRNGLGVVMNRAERLQERTDGENADLAAQIVDKSQTIVRRSEKARTIRKTVDSDQRLVAQDICTSLVGLVNSFDDEFPDAEFTIDMPPECRVMADSAIGVALENVLENALMHAEAPRIEVSVTRTDEHAQIEVVDDGPGIPEYELTVIDSESETPLQHGSGIGLWLITLIVDRSNGSVDFERLDGETVVTIQLERAPSADATHEGAGEAPGKRTCGGDCDT